MSPSTVPSFDAAALLNARMRVQPPNPISAAMIRAGELKRAGYKVVNFSVGEPDFDTPERIRDAAVAAMRAGHTRYTPTDGTAELKSAVQTKFSRENQLEYRLDQISVGSGAKQVIYNALACTLDPGDEVVIPAPYWTSYPEAVTICGGKPVIVRCGQEDGFKLRPETLRAALTDRTKWLVLNSPSNPTGSVYSESELRGIADVVGGHPSMMIMADDIYEHLLYTGKPFRNIAAIAPNLFERTLTVNGVSKTYAMTGWRIGYGGGPTPLIRAMANLQSQATSNPCSISQAAAVSALNGPQDIVGEWRSAFERRRDLLTGEINNIDGLSCLIPDGAFYVYVDCGALIGRTAPSGDRIASDVDFARYLLDAHHVAVVHGGAFGLSPFFRISYATSEAEIAEGCRRLRQACADLRP